MRHIKRFLRWLGIIVSEPAKHVWVNARAKTEEKCLRKLENLAELPYGSLRIDVRMRSAAHSSDHVFSRQFSLMYSKHTEADNARVLEVSGWIQIFGDSRFPLEVDGNFYQGKVEVRRNCTGYFRKGICTACGAHDEGIW